MLCLLLHFMGGCFALGDLLFLFFCCWRPKPLPASLLPHCQRRRPHAPLLFLPLSLSPSSWVFFLSVVYVGESCCWHLILIIMPLPPPHIHTYLCKFLLDLGLFINGQCFGEFVQRCHLFTVVLCASLLLTFLIISYNRARLIVWLVIILNKLCVYY